MMTQSPGMYKKPSNKHDNVNTMAASYVTSVEKSDAQI